MKNHFLLFILFLSCQNVFAQVVGGALLSDKRKCLAESKFIFEGNVNAQIVYKVSVNNEGQITAATIDGNKSDKISTPTQVQAMSNVKSIHFEKGTWWPKMHQGEIRITLVKPNTEE